MALGYGTEGYQQSHRLLHKDQGTAVHYSNEQDLLSTVPECAEARMICTRTTRTYFNLNGDLSRRSNTHVSAMKERISPGRSPFTFP